MRIWLRFPVCSRTSTSDASPNVSSTSIVADRLDGLRILRIRHRLLQRIVIPRQVIAPSAAGGTRVSVNHRPVDALRLAPRELILDGPLGRGGLGEHHDARGVAIDAMNHEGHAPTALTEVVGKQAEHRWRSLASSQRHGKKPGGLVHDEQRLVLVENLQPRVLTCLAEAPEVRRRALPGQSTQNLTTSPEASRLPASCAEASTSLRNT